MSEQILAQKQSKGTKIVIITIVVLAVAVVILAILNYSNLAERLALQESGTFLLTVEGYTHTVSPDDLNAIGGVDVSASSRGEQRNFTGVPLAGVFTHFDIDYSGASSVAFRSIDGFTTAVSIAEALDYTNVFVVFREDGEPLGTMNDGGIGPYMVVVVRDSFPNRWARYLMEVIVR